MLLNYGSGFWVRLIVKDNLDPVLLIIEYNFTALKLNIFGLVAYLLFFLFKLSDPIFCGFDRRVIVSK